jgi:glycosyltransferase involved in cell wall biosynthesis
MKKVSVALPYPVEATLATAGQFVKLLEALAGGEQVERIQVLHQGPAPRLRAADRVLEKVSLVAVESWFSGGVVGRVLEAASDYVLFVFPPATDFDISPRDLARFVEAAEINGAGLLYSDYRSARGGEVMEITTADYQPGSVRESFDFGALALVSGGAARRVLKEHGPVEESLRWAGFYDLRLKLSTDFPVERVPESLYVLKMPASRPALPGPGGRAKGFATVDLNNWDYQLELERVLDAHLRRIGAHLGQSYAPLPPPAGEFPVTASVVIPVRDRQQTIREAVESALAQKTDFDYNVIVVDDHSTDSTSDILRQMSRQDSRLVHLMPARRDLAIGGLWNEAVYSEACGLYAVQLDSDDVYAGPDSLRRIVRKFFEPPADGGAGYAMVTGSLTFVDANLKPLGPGLFEHREFSEENGRNTALRMNGTGAPRAFYVPVLRQFGFPNVSYGEDYAISLRIGREYRVGRVFGSLYLARQWEGNTIRSMPLGSVKSTSLKELLPPGLGERADVQARLQPLVAVLKNASRNRYDYYKDWLRSSEIRARQSINGRAAEPLHSHAPGLGVGTSAT